MEVVGVRIEMPSNQPIFLLKEMEGTTFLPIWVGSVEATAIAFAQQDLKPQRPLTHDLSVELHHFAAHGALGSRRPRLGNRDERRALRRHHRAPSPPESRADLGPCAGHCPTARHLQPEVFA